MTSNKYYIFFDFIDNNLFVGVHLQIIETSLGNHKNRGGATKTLFLHFYIIGKLDSAKVEDRYFNSLSYL